MMNKNDDDFKKRYNIAVTTLSVLLVAAAVVISFNRKGSEDLLISSRDSSRLEKVLKNENSIIGIGGAYKPNIIDAPVSYFDYYIKQGESIYSISRKFGIDDVSIVNVNDIKFASLVVAGRKISIPNQDGIIAKIKNESDFDAVIERHNFDKEDLLRINSFDLSSALNAGEVFLPGVKVDNETRQLMLGEYFLRPAYGRITSYFGFRRDPWTGKRSFHQGIDIANVNGGYIYAAAPGRVIYTGYSWIYGNNIKIRHTSGYVSFYAHLDSISVQNGAWVQSGGIIGRMGNTGRSTGTHLHFEVRQHGRAINPLRVTIFR